jgi:hypothetical protein
MHLAIQNRSAVTYQPERDAAGRVRSVPTLRFVDMRSRPARAAQSSAQSPGRVRMLLIEADGAAVAAAVGRALRPSLWRRIVGWL